MSHFLLKPGHFDYIIMRVCILFKPSVLAGVCVTHRCRGSEGGVLPLPSGDPGPHWPLQTPEDRFSYSSWLGGTYFPPGHFPLGAPLTGRGRGPAFLCLQGLLEHQPSKAGRGSRGQVSPRSLCWPGWGHSVSVCLAGLPLICTCGHFRLLLQQEEVPGTPCHAGAEVPGGCFSWLSPVWGPVPPASRSPLGACSLRRAQHGQCSSLMAFNKLAVCSNCGFTEKLQSECRAPTPLPQPPVRKAPTSSWLSTS